MKFTAQFNFDKVNSTNGATIQAGDDEAFTLNGIARPYQCDDNELLVVDSMEMLGDKFGMVKKCEVVIDGYESHVDGAVKPGKTLNVKLSIKLAKDMHVPVHCIDYPIIVNLDVTQYRVIAIEN